MKKLNQVQQLDFESFAIATRSDGRVSSSLGDIVKTAQQIAEKNPGLKIKRLFTIDGVHPYDEVEWERRDASIVNDKGEVVFERRDVKIPSSWSQTALNVVASKYFHTRLDAAIQENSIKQLINRVVGTIVEWGKKDGYFDADEDAQIYSEELTHLLLYQKASFNSPVWFNLGVEKKPQCSACFINSVDDTMESILDLAKTEGLLFKWGSGTGTNLSSLRSSKERLSTGGFASGPVSFMKGYDAFAGVIKSGGKTRRAAKMVILNIDHPDIVEFINCKADEEKKAWALIDAGYDGSFGGEAYSSVFFQNSNNSVRVTDDFMGAVETDGEWHTRYLTTGKPADTYKARHLMQMIAEAAHLCGDPGIQFDTTTNNWHTCPNSNRINASNPCSEYMFVDNSSCNLASINLLKFQENDSFNAEAFCHAVHLMIIAQEIIVDNASYPNLKIEDNSHKFRPLGLGYANLGALLMSQGLPYDSEEGRAVAASLTAMMTGQAYKSSAMLASIMGPFSNFEKNREPMLNVIDQHIDAIGAIDSQLVPDNVFEAVVDVWREAREAGEEYGFRNAQVTVLAPTGTIGFMMDCDTTGIEPDIALVKYKKLVDGGIVKLVNSTVPKALATLGYNNTEIEEIKEYIKANDTIEGAPFVKKEHLPVFDCAFKPPRGERFIHRMGHVRMMAAAQPFISGAISKTVNMPNESTVEDIIEAYISAWKMGLKAIAIYRDGSKRVQPVSTAREGFDKKLTKPKPFRRHLPDERNAITHKFSVQGHEGYLTVGMYDDGTPGEIFVVMAKEGSVVSGLMDCFATAVSMNFQYGVPLKVLVNKFSHTRFEPSGFTTNPEIPIAKSISDYIFRWLALKFLPKEEHPLESKNEEDIEVDNYKLKTLDSRPKQEQYVIDHQIDSPPCSECGAIMVRSGSCYKCMNCGITSGCS